MKENEHVAETRDWTMDIKIFSLTLSQLSYFGLFVVNFHVEIALFIKTQTLRKSANWILEPIHKRLYWIWQWIFQG